MFVDEKKTSWCLLPRARRGAVELSQNETCPTLVVLGSGGHTAEMLALLGGMDSERYQPLHLVVAETDKTSLPKLESAYPSLAARATVHQIRRSREVGQSFISSAPTTLMAALDSVRIVFNVQPALVLCNGPGTCVPICAAVVLLRFFGFSRLISPVDRSSTRKSSDPCIIFVESFCRVKSLSLTGKILYRVADRFVVQWPELAQKFQRAEYLGTLF